MHVELQPDKASDIDIVKGADDFHGDVGLAGPDGLIWLIPTPSPDPRGMSHI